MSVAPTSQTVQTPKGFRRKAHQLARDRAIMFDLHCRGYSIPEIVARLYDVTAPDGYALQYGQVAEDLKGERDRIEAKAELSARLRRSMIEHRMERRRVQLEALIAQATGEIEETVTKRKDVLEDVTNARSGKAERKPIGGYTEVQRRTKRQIAPASYFAELTALDRLEMDLFGLAVKDEVDPNGDVIDVEAKRIADREPLDYEGFDALMLQMSAPGSVVYLDADPDAVE